MDLRQVECFLAVANHLHFGRASRELHISQTAVSESVARLERDLGGPLFTRTTRRVELTPLGESFLADAVPAYEGLRRAYQRAQATSQTTGSALVVGYCHDAERRVMLGLVSSLRRKHPDTVIDFQPLSATRMVNGIRAATLDIGMCYTPILDVDISARRIGSTSLVALVRAGHPLALRPDVTLDELARERIVLLERTGNPRLYDSVVAALDEANSNWQLAATVSDIGNLAARTLAGDGVAVAVAAAVPTSPVDGVVCVPLTDGPAIEKVLIWRSDEEREVVLDLVHLIITAFAGHSAQWGARPHADYVAAEDRRVS